MTKTNTTSSSSGCALALEDAIRVADISGKHHWRVCLAVLLATLSGGSSGSTAPFILQPLTEDLKLSPFMTGALASAIFVGMWVGSFLGGFLGVWFAHCAC